MYLDFLCCAIALASLVAADAGEDARNGVTITRSATPQSIITPPPVFHGELHRRALATCGYIRGNSASPLTCPDGYNCITTVRLQPAFACCNNIECLGNWGVCQDYGENNCQGYNLPADTCSSIYGSILQCSQEAPNCFRYARSSVLGAQVTFYSYACGTASTDILVLATPTNGANQNPASTPGGAQSFPIPGISIPPLASASSGQKSSSGNKSPLSTTAIVLIVLLGGGTLVVALGIGCCCILRRYRQNQQVVYNPPLHRAEYVPTVTNGPGPGSINTWNAGVPLGAPPSVVSGPPASEYSGPTVVSGRFGQRSYY